MTGSGLAVRESTFDIAPKAWDIAEKIARTSSVPAAFRGKPDEIMATILVGHELNLSAMTSLQQIHVIEGRPTLSAQLMVGVVMSHGHEIWVDDDASNNSRVTVCGQRKGSTHVQRVTWTMDDAKAAGLAGKQNWRKYQRQMLTARARAEMCRLLAPDVLAGIAYSREEVEDGFIFDEPVEETEVEDTPTGGNVRQLGAKKAPAKKAPAKKAAAKKSARPAPAATAVEDLPPLPGDDDTPAPVGGDDEDVVDAEIVDEAPAEDADAVRRAQQIAMRARDLEVDHHDVVYVVTGGRATSAKGLSQDEYSDVMEAFRQIKVGEKALDTSGEEPRLVDPPEEPADEVGALDVGDCDTWDGETWKSWLGSQRVKVVPTLREAKRLAGDMGLEEPMSLADLQGTSLAALVAAWVMETSR